MQNGEPCKALNLFTNNLVVSMDCKRQAIQDLLCAGWSPTVIARDLKVSRHMVYNCKKRFKETGDARRKHGGGRPRTKNTPDLRKAIKAKVKRNPRRSLRRLAKDHDVSRKTISNCVKDLSLRSRVVPVKHLITNSCQKKRLERCHKILNILKHPMRGLDRIILFSDEKLFTVDSSTNRRNDRYLATSKRSDIVRFRTKHPARVMVFGLVASDGKVMPPVFIDAGLKVNTEEYIKILANHVKPWILRNYDSDVQVVFQQDGAPAHTSKRTQDWLTKNLSSESGELGFWAKDV